MIPPYGQMHSPNGIPMDSYQQYHQFQQPQLTYPPNPMVPQYPLQATNGINYPTTYGQHQYPYMNSAYPMYPYQQPWQQPIPIPTRTKPQP